MRPDYGESGSGVTKPRLVTTPAKSIRWRLVGWYTALSTSMAVVFGGITYVNVSRTFEREVDRLLSAEADALAAAITPARDGTFDLELSSDQVNRFQQDDELAPYYCIWNENAEFIDGSDPSLRVAAPSSAGSRTRNGFREVFIAGPAKSSILVGRSTKPEQDQLRSLAKTGALLTIAVMLVMLLGGWFLINKSLEPIERISRAAGAISESNLSARIDVSRMESELGALSTTINDAFDRVQSAFDRQTQFTADASHELRTPLSIVTAQTDFALLQPRTPEEYQEALTSIRRAANRMRNVVEGLLTLARADTSDAQFHMLPVDVSEVVTEAISLLRPLTDSKGITVTTNLTSTLIRADRDRLFEAVSNLLTNAIHYNRENGRIDVSIQANSESVELSVADSGLGIPVSAEPHVFDRFFRADSARSRGANEGSGLGLSITKWIVEAHGGGISVTSEEGVGTQFIVTFPYVDSASRAGSGQNGSNPKPSVGSMLK